MEMRLAQNCEVEHGWYGGQNTFLSRSRGEICSNLPLPERGYIGTRREINISGGLGPKELDGGTCSAGRSTEGALIPLQGVRNGKGVLPGVFYCTTVLRNGKYLCTTYVVWIPRQGI